MGENVTVGVQSTKENMPVVDAHVTPPFYTSASKKFYVDGTKIPDVNWDAGPSYSGLMPISGAKNETRKLFFWQVIPSTST
jgi:endo-beta-N-acetylglucosaminidase D